MLRNPEISNQEYISGTHKWKYYKRAKIPFIPIVNSEHKIDNQNDQINEKVSKKENEESNR